MDRKEKLNRIFLILLSLFVVMLGYGILLPTLPYYTERLALKDNLDTVTLSISILDCLRAFIHFFSYYLWWFGESFQTNTVVNPLLFVG